jgi:hypothetical protein
VDVQQPFGQEVASQTHCPLPLHSWPEAQAPQTAPPAPQDELDSLVGSSHVSLAVQHPGHEVPAQVHVPPVHASPFAQALQAAPPVPHSVPDWDETATHFPLAVQQPVGHEVASQVQRPLLVSHSSPDRHASQLAPPTPHWREDCDECATQSPFSVQHPSAHVRGPQPVAPSEGASGTVWSAMVPSRPRSDLASMEVVASPASQSPPLQDALVNPSSPERFAHPRATLSHRSAAR